MLKESLYNVLLKKGKYMEHKKSYAIMVALSCIFIIYFIATIYENDFWANIFSPCLAISAFGIIFKTALKFKGKQRHDRKIPWLTLSFACLSWGIADITWVIYESILNLDPQESYLISNLYSFTNVFLFISVLIFSIKLSKKWNVMQLIIDSVAISMSILFLLWIVFFDKQLDVVQFCTSNELTIVISILLDLIMLIVLFTIYFSVRNGKIAFYVNLIICGINLFSISDLYYYYLSYKQYYIPNSIIDAVNIASLLLIAVAAHLNHEYNKDYYEISTTNIGFKKNFYLIIIFPILAIVLEGFVLVDIIVFLFILSIRYLLTFYLQLSINNGKLLRREKQMNFILEYKIEKRTKEVVEKNIELEYIASHDSITNLYNRRYIISELPKSMDGISSYETITFILLDIDRFKTINDIYGHDIGDEVLMEISKKLEAVKKEYSILARLGGDEFCIVYRSQLGYDKAEEISNNINELCREPIKINQYVFSITASIGISIYPFDAKDVNSLMKNADIAMNQAKAKGKNRFLSFNSELKNYMDRKNKIEILLRTADYDKEFKLFYQPQFRISDKKLIGAEALVRWNSKKLGFISPGEFIPISEEINVITELGKWILNTAIHQIKVWSDKYSIDFKVGINISPKQLDYVSFVSDFKNILAENNVSPQLVDIEILESIAMEGEEKIKQVYSLFENLGVSISMDDFGTGYSSLSYLKILPFDKIKIAKQLIDTISTDNYDMQIVKSICMLAKSLGIKTIAEGVEYQEQFDILAELGCDQIQGYLLGKPMSVEKFEETFLK